ncbi:MAG: hypothetical protein ACQERB_08085 [Promethearchaeati archaeon]
MRLKVILSLFLIGSLFFTPLTRSTEALLNKIDTSIENGKIEMRTTAGYNWWYYIPESLHKSDFTYIFLEESHAQIEDYNNLTEDAKINLEGWKIISEMKKYILVTVAIPRNFSRGYYPQGINWYSLNNSTPEFYYRPDLKVNTIISEFLSNLTNAGYSISEKILVSGFSAGGMWANRYTLLHPDRIKAVAIGQAGGWLAMPISEYNGSELNWPMGINDFYNLTGSEYYKQELLKSVPQFIFIGDSDNSSTYHTEPWLTEEEIKIWGNSDPERLETQCNYLQNSSYNVRFKKYSDVEHSFTINMKLDVLEFFDVILGDDGGTISNFPFSIFFSIALLSLIAIVKYSQKHRKLINSN